MVSRTDPLALAIDIGSSSVRAIAYTVTGEQIPESEHRERYKLELTADGGSMCDPHRIRRLTAKCIRKTCERLGDRLANVAVVGISCHWHSLLGLDSVGNPLTPVYMWSDKRASNDADALATELNAEAIHQRTGCRLHSSYWPAKLHWLHRTRSEVSDRVMLWCGLSDWLFAAPGTQVTTSLSMASATGLLTTRTASWDAALVSHLGIDAHALPPIVDRTTPIPAASIHPDLLPPGLNATWYPAVGDGAAANIGVGAVDRSGIALTIGTSGAIRMAGPLDNDHHLPPSLFRYLIDRETSVIGGALSNGGNMVAWLSNLAKLGDPRDSMRAAAAIPPDSHGLTVLPFFAGERAPSWQDRVGGTITGMTLDTTAIQIYRAMLEATALRFAQVYRDLSAFADREHAVYATGGALLQSPLWCQITADALGHSIDSLSARLEASARGAAVSSLHAAGYVPALQLSERPTSTFAPRLSATEIYAHASERLRALERALVQWEQETRYDYR